MFFVGFKNEILMDFSIMMYGESPHPSKKIYLVSDVLFVDKISAILFFRRHALFDFTFSHERK